MSFFVLFFKFLKLNPEGVTECRIGREPYQIRSPVSNSLVGGDIVSRMRWTAILSHLRRFPSALPGQWVSTKRNFNPIGAGFTVSRVSRFHGFHFSENNLPTIIYIYKRKKGKLEFNYYYYNIYIVGAQKNTLVKPVKPMKPQVFLFL